METTSTTSMPQNNTLVLPQSPTLADFQEYVIKLKQLRGFNDDKKNALIFLFNEVGELGSAMAKSWGSEQVTPEAREKIMLEMADVFIFLLDLANQYNINLEDAFRKKEEINKQRIWAKHHRV